jgi:hypothetical protein
MLTKNYGEVLRKPNNQPELKFLNLKMVLVKVERPSDVPKFSKSTVDDQFENKEILNKGGAFLEHK